jgi:subtilisin family serine protease
MCATAATMPGSNGMTLAVSAGWASWKPGAFHLSSPSNHSSTVLRSVRWPAAISSFRSPTWTKTNERIHHTSSQGPTRDGREKPDIAAPGTNIVAANGFNPDQPWVSMTGTSMASPYVAGVVARMLAADPKADGCPDRRHPAPDGKPAAGH